MKVVAIFDHNKELGNTFVYHDNMSDGSLPSFTKGTINQFIDQINKLINKPMDGVIDSSALTNLFTSGFMTVISSNRRK
jgi:hypothetical protein